MKLDLQLGWPDPKCSFEGQKWCLCLTMWDGDWPSGVKGICPVRHSVSGSFGALKMHQNALKCLWDPINAPKCPRMSLGALQMHQNATKIAYVTNRMTPRGSGAACDSPHRRKFALTTLHLQSYLFAWFLTRCDCLLSVLGRWMYTRGCLVVHVRLPWPVAAA